MALDGIPIPDTQEIGDSLPFINNSFLSLDTRLESASSVLTTNLATASSSLTTALTSLSSVLTIDIASLSSLQSTLIPASATFVSNLTATSLTLTTRLTALSSSIDQWNTNFNSSLATKANLTHTHNLSDITTTSNSVYFNGTTDYLSASNSLSAFNIGNMSNFTIECWIFPLRLTGKYPSAPGQYGPLIAGVMGAANTQQYSWMLNQQSDQHLSFNISAGNTVYFGPTVSPETLKLYDWNHVAVVRNGNFITLYLNGIGGSPSSDVRAAGTLNRWANFPLTFGKWTNATTANVSQYYRGYISNFRFVRDQAVYTSNFNPPSTPLSISSQGAIAGNTLMLALQKRPNNGLFTNISLSATKLSVTSINRPENATTISEISPFDLPYSQESVYFNGSSYLTLPDDNAWDVGGNSTIEFWFNMTQNSALNSNSVRDALLLAQNVDNANGWTLHIRGSSSTTGTSIEWNSTLGPTSLIYTFPFIGGIPKAQWNHLAISTDGSNIRMFYNGSLVATAAYTATTNFASNLSIGRLLNFTPDRPNGFVGYMSNLRITKGQTLYTENFVVPTAPLTTTSQGAVASNVALLTFQGANPIVDYSSSPKTFTTNGSLRTFGFTPNNPIANGSVFFKRQSFFNGDYVTAKISSSSGPYAEYIYNLGGLKTIELWFYITRDYQESAPSPYTKEMTLLSYDDSVPGNKWSISITGTDVIGGTGIRVETGSTAPGYTSYSGAVLATYNNTIRKGQWHHLALVYTASNIQLYLNGVSVSTSTNIVTTTGTNDTLYIGARSDGGYQFDGFISNVRITKQALYTQEFVPSTQAFTTTSQGALSPNVLLIALQGSEAFRNTFTNFESRPIDIGSLDPALFNPLDTRGSVTLSALLDEEATLDHTHSQSSIVDLYKINSALTSNNLLSGEIINFNVLDQTTFYYPNSASGPFSLNIRGNDTTPLSTILNIGESTKISFLNTTRLSASGLSSLRIDNVPQTVRWLNGITPTPTLCSTNLWEFNIFEMPVAAVETTGTVNNYGVFGSMKRYNTFVLTANALVVAGGASGGGSVLASTGGGGGGGAGGYRLFTDHLFEPGATYLVIVGAGGAQFSTFSGGNSTITTTTSAYGPVYISTGGGRGGGGLTSSYNSPDTGGSGGGAGADATPATGTSILAGAAGNTPSTIPVQGFAGGNSYADASPGLNRNGGGGGGASAVGGNATASAGGVGGAGVSVTVAGVAKNVAGGGGGGVGRTGGAAAGGAGGLGGGGAGGGASTSPVAGTANTGGGGGGGGNSTSYGTGASGGSGIIQIWYAGTVERAIGGTITKPAGFVLHTFNSSGIFTVL